MQQASIKTSKDANNLGELLDNSLSHTDKSKLTGEILNKLKNDADFLKWKNQIIKALKADPRFGKLTFIKPGRQLINFGGDAWSSLSNFESASENELTWAVRHAFVDVSATAKTDGTIVLDFKMSDTLDLSSQSGRGFGYNSISDVTGFLWHDIGGGNENMQVNASWSETTK